MPGLKCPAQSVAVSPVVLCQPVGEPKRLYRLPHPPQFQPPKATLGQEVSQLLAWCHRLQQAELLLLFRRDLVVPRTVVIVRVDAHSSSCRLDVKGHPMRVIPAGEEMAGPLAPRCRQLDRITQ